MAEKQDVKQDEVRYVGGGGERLLVEKNVMLNVREMVAEFTSEQTPHCYDYWFAVIAKLAAT